MMVNREHKDRLFKMIFGREEHREWTLSLYNAVNGTSYDDPSQIEFNTMEDVLYMGMKNDLSFLLDMRLSLYGHQSTYSPNFPLRCFLYLGHLWSGMIAGKPLIYSRRQIELPVPKCVIFYNGTDDEPDEMEMRLSDAFPEDKRGEADVELKLRLLNINKGHNSKLQAACRPMREYSWLIEAIRDGSGTMGIEEAVDKALEDMPDDFQIKEFLVRNREEVRMSVLTEYDEEATMKMLAEEFKEDWLEKGREEGRKEREALTASNDALAAEVERLKKELAALRARV